jgi:hypothetical protein
MIQNTNMSPNKHLRSLVKLTRTLVVVAPLCCRNTISTDDRNDRESPS